MDLAGPLGCFRLKRDAQHNTEDVARWTLQRGREIGFDL